MTATSILRATQIVRGGLRRVATRRRLVEAALGVAGCLPLALAAIWPLFLHLVSETPGADIGGDRTGTSGTCGSTPSTACTCGARPPSMR